MRRGIAVGRLPGQHQMQQTVGDRQHVGAVAAGGREGIGKERGLG